MGCSHTIIPASEGHLFACPGSRIGSRVRWIRANEPDYVAERSAIALELAKAGYAEQVCLGHDGSPAGLWAGWSEQRNSDCWTRVPEHEVPWLLAHGASDDDVDAMLRRSIRATFEAAAA